MNIKKKVLLGVSSFALLGALALPQSASAFGGNFGGKGTFDGNEDRPRLIPEEMREEFRAEQGNLSEEDMATRRETKMVFREEKRVAMQEFTGLTHEEMREVRQKGESMGDTLAENGVTQEDTEAFLTEQASNRVDSIVERHDLDESAEQILKDRIAEFVQNILSRWFVTE